VQDTNKINKEYGRCFKLEKNRTSNIPRCFLKVDKKTAQKIIFHLCYSLGLPQPDDIVFGFLACGVGACGKYCITQNAKVKISFNGIFKFRIGVIVHEIAHHLSVINYCDWEHGDVFLGCENKTFDALEELIRLKVVKDLGSA
jgi:hypothetical protein